MSMYPTVDSIVDSGLMTNEERRLYESAQSDPGRWHLPVRWAQRMFNKHLDRSLVQPPVERDFLVEIKDYRHQFTQIFSYDWVCIPMVYTHVATLATYGFFIFCLIGRQFLDPAKGLSCCKVDFYFPVFTCTQFLFYVGWCKVGQDLMRPFGSDDDDIEVVRILRRNLIVSFSMAHENEYPDLQEDKIWSSLSAELTKTTSLMSTNSHATDEHSGSTPTTDNNAAAQTTTTTSSDSGFAMNNNLVNNGAHMLRGQVHLPPITVRPDRGSVGWWFLRGNVQQPLWY